MYDKCSDCEYKDVENLRLENQELKKRLEKKYEKVGTLTAEILYEENTRLVNEITVLKTENQNAYIKSVNVLRCFKNIRN